jgi:hypothetical protein
LTVDVHADQEGIVHRALLFLEVVKPARLPREENPWHTDETNSLATIRTPPVVGMLLGLLPETTAGYEQDAGQKSPSARGAQAFAEVTLAECNKEELRFPPWTSLQAARDSLFVKQSVDWHAPYHIPYKDEDHAI